MDIGAVGTGNAYLHPKQAELETAFTSMTGLVNAVIQKHGVIHETGSSRTPVSS
jgi:hypothetical protein